MAVAIIVFMIATAIFLMNHTEDCLTVRNGKTGEILGAYPLGEGGEFSVGFIHSVNQSPVIDYYRITEGEIMVYQTQYDTFGAGVQTALDAGETLEVGAEGSMIVGNINQVIPTLSYIISPVYDHVLNINGETLSLKELAGEQRLVTLVYEKQ